MVEARRNADKVEERYDLFSGLLDAAQNEPDAEASHSSCGVVPKQFPTDHSAYTMLLIRLVGALS